MISDNISLVADALTILIRLALPPWHAIQLQSLWISNLGHGSTLGQAPTGYRFSEEEGKFQLLRQLSNGLKKCCLSPNSAIQSSALHLMDVLVASTEQYSYQSDSEEHRSALDELGCRMPAGTEWVFSCCQSHCVTCMTVLQVECGPFQKLEHLQHCFEVRTLI